ncbi:VOC family protein [Thiolapillus brandeum]|uniref:Glyoxalase family protein n=1 Tax=Thiolapillus brandeum TaxID=1076588 RepID=A0A7U6GI47_9GAMM|nr:VOC family protein [Thiolapillus brandeum]BAO44074.1 glyoxalase family protein [Thiolapillus brandeum]
MLFRRTGYRPAAGFILLASLLIGGCSSLKEAGGTGEEFSLPQITDKATGEYHPGKFVWHDLLTTDEVKSQTFYGELLGWSFRNSGEYIQVYNGDQLIGGILTIRPEPGKARPVSGQWLAFMSVEDVDRAAETVKAKGGTIINGPMSLGERGRGVLISDPAGAQLLLLHANGGDPKDREPGIGDWLWNEVWTLEPGPLVSFYTEVGQYEDTLQGDEDMILLNEGHWRAGIRPIAQKAYAGRWVPAVRVEDPASLLDKVRKLGGSVLLAPGQEGASEDTALITDNSGSLLILQRWTFPSDKEAH